MSNKQGDCGCDEKQSLKGLVVQYDQTGYNAEYCLSLSEAQFVDHPMHNGNYTELETPVRIEQLKKVYLFIKASFPRAKVDAVVDAKKAKEVKETPVIDPKPETEDGNKVAKE